MGSKPSVGAMSHKSADGATSFTGPGSRAYRWASAGQHTSTCAYEKEKPLYKRIDSESSNAHRSCVSTYSGVESRETVNRQVVVDLVSGVNSFRMLIDDVIEDPECNISDTSLSAAVSD